MPSSWATDFGCPRNRFIRPELIASILVSGFVALYSVANIGAYFTILLVNTVKVKAIFEQCQESNSVFFNAGPICTDFQLSPSSYIITPCPQLHLRQLPQPKKAEPTGIRSMGPIVSCGLHKGDRLRDHEVGDLLKWADEAFPGRAVISTSLQHTASFCFTWRRSSV